MSVRHTLKRIHFVSTVWLITCIGYLLVLTLRQAGLQWWLIFSLSGHSVVIVLLLVSLYLFAIFRGIGRSQEIIEHPLTSTNYYMFLYGVFPFLGAMAGCLTMIGVNSVSQFLLGIALGTFATTFLGWIIVDPLMGMLEMLLPASRKHRYQLLAKARALQEKIQKSHEQLLAEVLEKENSDRRRWQQVLTPQAERLAGILTGNIIDVKAQYEVADIGVNAWQVGGLSCMRQLHDMVMNICKKRCQNKSIVDYISIWWDGIGNWRSPSLSEKINFS